MTLPPTGKETKTSFGLLEDYHVALSDFSVFHNKGILASAGGWHDQSDDWRDAMLYLGDVLNEEIRSLKAQASIRR